MRRGALAHLQSYFYRFSERACNSAEFESYWRNLFLSNNKHAVIHQCEIKLTGWFRDRGFTTGCFTDTQALRAALLGLDEARLLQALAYQQKVETRIAPTTAPILAAGRIGPVERARLKALSDKGGLGSYLMISHPYVLETLHLPVLKKDRQPIYALQRAEMIRTGFADTLLPEVRAEIAARDLSGNRPDKPANG